MKLFRKDLPSMGPELVHALSSPGFLDLDRDRECLLGKFTDTHPATNAILENSLVQDWQKTPGGGRIFIIPEETSDAAVRTDLHGVYGRDLVAILPGCMGFWFKSPIDGEYFSMVRLQESSVVSCKVMNHNTGNELVLNADHLAMSEYSEREWSWDKTLVVAVFHKERISGEMVESVSSFCAPIWDDREIAITEGFIASGEGKSFGARVTCLDLEAPFDNFEPYNKTYDPDHYARLVRMHLNLLLVGGSYPDYIKKATVNKRVAKGKGSKKLKTVAHPVFELRTNVLEYDREVSVCSGSGDPRKSHWRRGHWRRQPHSASWQLANPGTPTITLPDGREAHMAWIEPILVNQ